MAQTSNVTVVTKQLLINKSYLIIHNELKHPQ